MTVTLMQPNLQQSIHQELPEEVEVTVLLSGGQEFTMSLPSDSSLLEELYDVLMDWEGKRLRRLFQIPINKGRSMLTFPCDRLVGLVTEPPIVIQQEASVTQHAQPNRESTALPADSRVELSDCVQLDSFLSPKQQQRLLDYVLQHESDFVPTQTSTGELNYRQSVVLYSFPEFAELLNQRIQTALPDILAKLNLPHFSITQIESQLTAHNDNNFYKIHNDNGSSDTATRELTYVYYFYREPKAFSGGELLIYDSKIENNYYVQAESYRTVEPRNNSIVFFRSRLMHEVLPIHCPSRNFADSRFTINGWIRR
jgi:Rps23 Pro-64 3,4-dihydroxylase Tpa1-like proline 4-hydroxylase